MSYFLTQILLIRLVMLHKWWKLDYVLDAEFHPHMRDIFIRDAGPELLNNYF